MGPAETLTGDVVPVLLLAAVLVAAVLQPHRLPEAVVAVGAAVVVLATGAIEVAEAEAELERLAPVLAFLAALLVLARLCADEGIFEAAGRRLVRGAQEARGAPDGSAHRRFLAATFVVATLTTLALSLDATAVLLTPTVLVAARQAGLRPGPSVHLVGHLTNSASLLLPVANLTNLLALATLTDLGVDFLHFVALMALPAAVVLAVEHVGTRRYFAVGSRPGPPPPATPAEAGEAAAGEVPDDDAEPTPWPAVVLLALTLAAIAVTGSMGIEPFWAAVAGAGTMAVHALARGRTRPVSLVRAVDVPFLVFVGGLTIVVRAVTESRVGEVIHAVTPSGEGLVALLGFTLLAAVLANLANNLPALLVLLVPAAAAGPLAVLAVLIGVNVGPNLTYVGSLATLLWRRSLRWNGEQVVWGTFLRHGLVTVPAQLLLGTTALWVAGLLLAP